MKGLMMGFIQLVMFNVYALAFFIGGKFVAAGTIGFDDFLWHNSVWLSLLVVLDMLLYLLVMQQKLIC